jgi:hypothetical protein
MTPPATAAASAPAAVPPRRARPTRPARTPRRVSGPARRPAREAAAGSLTLPATGIAVGALEALAGLSQHRLLDRLIRGRAWIGLVAFALIGIVAMQLWVLKLNAGIGRAVEHESWLQRDNSRLGIEISEISSGDLVEQAATEKGMVIVPPGALHFDRVRGPLDARLAAGALGSSAHVSASSTSSAQVSSGASTVAGGEAPGSSGEVSSAGGEASGSGGGSSSSSGAESSSTPAAKGSEGTSSPSSSSTAATGETSPPPAGSSTSEAASGPASGGSTEAASSAPVGAPGGIQAGQSPGQPSSGQSQPGPQE